MSRRPFPIRCRVDRDVFRRRVKRGYIAGVPRLLSGLDLGVILLYLSQCKAYTASADVIAFVDTTSPAASEARKVLYYIVYHLIAPHVRFRLSFFLL